MCKYGESVFDRAGVCFRAGRGGGSAFSAQVGAGFVRAVGQVLRGRVNVCYFPVWRTVACQTGRRGKRQPETPGLASDSRTVARNVHVLGRTVETSAVARLLRDTASGRGGALFITGEPGVGRTTLLRRILTLDATFRSAYLAGTAAESSPRTTAAPPPRPQSARLSAAYRNCGWDRWTRPTRGPCSSSPPRLSSGVMSPSG
ncbi:ATP-binding protein [Streptomyces sp. SLBN-118]|uniref:ATP-binding protein n=1 Tax=Streptomyces sp. SLBN-118 TaxID=2768454 RepID=UPI0037DA36FA